MLTPRLRVTADHAGITKAPTAGVNMQCSSHLLCHCFTSSRPVRMVLTAEGNCDRLYRLPHSRTVTPHCKARHSFVTCDANYNVE